MKNHYLSFLLFSLISLTTIAQKHGAIQLQHFSLAQINFAETQFFAGDKLLGNADASGFFQPSVAVKKKMMIINPLCDTLVVELKLSKGDYHFIRIKSKKELDSLAKARFLETYVPKCEVGDEFEKDVDSLAQFEGGERALKRFLSETIRYPQNAIEEGVSGCVYIYFIVNEQGNVGCAEIAKSSGDNGLDKEALRVVNILPRFKPATKNGAAVKSVYLLPILFLLE